MAIPTADIKIELINRGYPDFLSDEQIESAAKFARLKMARFFYISKWYRFQTVSDQVEYNLFNDPGALVDPDGYEVTELIYDTAQEYFDPSNVFGLAPIIQNNWTGYGYTTDFTSEYTIFAMNLESWRKTYAEGSWRPVSNIPKANIILNPPPTSVSWVAVNYKVKNNDPDLDVAFEDAFYLLVESYVCKGPMAIGFSMQAGIQIGAFKDLGKSATNFADFGREKEAEALDILGQYELSTSAAVARS